MPEVSQSDSRPSVEKNAVERLDSGQEYNEVDPLQAHEYIGKDVEVITDRGARRKGELISANLRQISVRRRDGSGGEQILTEHIERVLVKGDVKEGDKPGARMKDEATKWEKEHGNNDNNKS